MALRFRFVLPLFLGFLVFHPADSNAQDKDAQLRKMLGASENTPVKVSLKPALPTTNPLKVALALDLDATVTKNFVAWVTEWNKSGDAKKYGGIELVEDVAEADVVLVRFVDRRTVAGTNTSGRSLAGSSSSSAMMPVYAYILKKKESGYEVVGGYEDTTAASASSLTGQNLWSEMRNLMKGRPKLK